MLRRLNRTSLPCPDNGAIEGVAEARGRGHELKKALDVTASRASAFLADGLEQP